MEKTREEIPARCEVHAEGVAQDAEEKRYAQDAVVALVQLAAPAGTPRTSASRRRDRSPCSRTRAATRSSGAPDRRRTFAASLF